jgi:hypothetical protein
VRVSIALFPRLAQNLIHTRCSFLWSIMKIVTGHVHDSKKTLVKTVHVNPARATWHTDLIDMAVLPWTGASRYHNCCIDGGTSPENFGQHLVLILHETKECRQDIKNIVTKLCYLETSSWSTHTCMHTYTHTHTHTHTHTQTHTNIQ